MTEQRSLADERDLFKPLPSASSIEERPVNLERIKLGKLLYSDVNLSKSKKISCNSCHKLSKYGVDNEPTSPGHEEQRGDRNSPTVYNASLHVAQFWDGRAKDVEEQALGPILNPIEMAISKEKDVTDYIKSTKIYPKLFKLAFSEDKDPITFKNVGIAIGAFERTLLTPSRFDKYLRGDESAITLNEKKGLKKFVEVGCATCHNGVGIGGGMYQKLGLVKPYETKDLGRYNFTKSEGDKYFFKVPSLRNVTETSPYFHDGSVKTLQDAIKLMGTHQLGKTLNDQDVSDIVVFLNSLTGSIPDNVK